jgi:cellulose synthase/poly-beta-1,6-N-acetylglucosamine synthase-like glycosyltransferase
LAAEVVFPKRSNEISELKDISIPYFEYDIEVPEAVNHNFATDDAKTLLSAKQLTHILMLVAATATIAYIKPEAFTFYAIIAFNLINIFLISVKNYFIFTAPKFDTRPLVKPAYVSKMLEDLGAEEWNISDIHDALSTKSPQQIAAEVGLCKRSISVKLQSKNLPLYTILIPLFREEKVVDKLIKNISEIDYPKDKLQVILIVEADDSATLEHLNNITPPFEVVKVPYFLPRTKPKALCYAFRFVKGEYLVVYDAEDKPDIDQLKKAVQEFKTSPKEVICLQAALNYYNQGENLLTEMFALEYAALFEMMLPKMLEVDLAIPLGGTSNHFKVEKLKEIGLWDPYNLTEDADIGYRIKQKGYQIKMLHSRTLEEAPISLKLWLTQRKRWIKGFIQTYLVHMRNRDSSNFGVKSSLHFMLFLPTFIYLTFPIVLALHGLLYSKVVSITAHESEIVYSSSILLLIYAAISYISIGLRLRKELKAKALSIICFPFYLLLMIPAALMALIALIKNPHYWDKTPHGLSKIN